MLHTVSPLISNDRSFAYKEMMFRRYCHVYERLYTEFGLVVGFTEHLQNVITNNYSAIANSHTLQLTTARTKSSQSAVSSLVVVW
jgi:superfamily I DNA and RNA helicase